MRTTRANYAKAARAGALALDGLPRGRAAAELLRSIALKFEAPAQAAKALKSEFATQKEEISRKALGVIADAQLRFQDGQLTGRDLWVIADTVYDTTSGVVDLDISQLIYRARQELKEHAPI